MVAIAAVILLAGVVAACGGARSGGGKRTPRTPSGWPITPAGKLIKVPAGDPGLPGPWGVALSPNGKFALVSSSGAAVQYETTELFNLATDHRTAIRSYNGRKSRSVFYGVVFSPDGRHAWAAGAGQNVVHAYAVGARAAHADRPDQGPVLSGRPRLRAHAARRPSVRGGEPGREREPGGGPASHADPPGHVVTVIDPSRNRVTARIDLGFAGYPLAIAFDRRGDKAYVTSWAGRRVFVIDTRRQRVVRKIVLSPHDDPLLADHPTGIAANPRRDEVYTANANTDTVSVIDTRTDRVAATIDVGLVPGGPKGSTPVSVAVSPDGHTLYVADAGENAIAVVDLDTRRVVGFIPTGWYPASVQVTPDGRRLVVANTYGSGAGPNPAGPFVPTARYPRRSPRPHGPFYYYPGSWYRPRLSESQYAGTMIKGSLEVISLPGQLRTWTREVQRNDDAAARWRAGAGRRRSARSSTSSTS